MEINAGNAILLLTGRKKMIADEDVLCQILDQMVASYLATESCDFSDLVELCPFLDEKTVRKIADHVMKRKDYDTLGEIAPFM